MNSASYVSVDEYITEAIHNHVWTDEDGTTHATVRLGGPTIFFDDPETARKVAAACLAAADAMDAEIKRAAAAGSASAR